MLDWDEVAQEIREGRKRAQAGYRFAQRMALLSFIVTGLIGIAICAVVVYAALHYRA